MGETFCGSDARVETMKKMNTSSVYEDKQMQVRQREKAENSLNKGTSMCKSPVAWREDGECKGLK